METGLCSHGKKVVLVLDDRKLMIGEDCYPCLQDFADVSRLVVRSNSRVLLDLMDEVDAGWTESFENILEKE